MKLDFKDSDFKDFNLDTIGSDSQEMKDLKVRERGQGKSTISITPSTENQQMLQLAMQDWTSLSDFRDRRKRSRLYYRGDQWAELMDDPDNTGTTITEEEYITNQGKVPLKQNIIRQVVKNMIGQYLNSPSKSTVTPVDRKKAKEGEILTNTIRSVHNINKTDMLDTRMLEEFLLSGAIIQKIGYRYFRNRNMEDVMIHNCNPNRIFCNTDLTDVRLWDLRRVGELYDLDIAEVIGAFAKNEDDARVLRQIYVGSNMSPIPPAKGLSSDNVDSTDFFITVDPNKCRVIEIWYLKSAWRTYAHDTMDGSYNIIPYTLAQVDEINRNRIEMATLQGVPEDKVLLIKASRKYEDYWCAKYLSPWGHTLWEGETPFMHEEHPFVLSLYPLLDGEVWGFIEDIIDQQRYINRMITLMDFIIGFSAKGVLIVPEDAIPDGMELSDIATEWTKFNGVIKMKLKNGTPVPQQITGKAANNGLSEMLMLQLKLLQDISGVNPAIQGQQAKSGTPSSLYMQETLNASLNSKDYMETFNDFKQIRDMKVLKMIKQFYTEPRYITISGASFDDQEEIYDPDRVRDLDFEIAVTEGKDTPVYRQITEDTLFKLLEMQAINVEMFLENSSLPFADRMLEQIRQLRQQQQQMMAGGANGPLNPQMAQFAEQAQQQIQADPNTVAIMNQLMQG